MKHGVYVREQKTSVSTPVVAESGVPFVVGTAPVHSAESPAALFTPVLCTDWEDAVKKLGYSDDWKTYTICEVMYSHFKLFQRQPIIFCNVLDPSTNKEAVAGAEVTLSGKQAKLPFDAILSSLVVKTASSSESPLVKDTDYAAYYSDGNLIVETIEDGAAKAATKLYISYDKIKTAEIKTDADGHTTLLCGPASVKTESDKWRTNATLGLRLDNDTLDCDGLTWYAIPNAKEAEALLKKYLPL